jgi:hypothetical protein
MARYEELRCPACHALVGHVPRVRVAVGCPFQECPGCGALVPRATVNEWDFLGVGARARFGLERLAWAVSLALLPLLLYLVAARLLGWPSGPWTLGLLLLTGILVLGAPPALHGLRSVRRSRRRLGDPMYRAKLVEFERSNLARSR